MRNKSLFLLIACVCGTVAAIGVSQWMQAQDQGQGANQTIEIIVAAVDIDKGEEITAEKLRLEQWPAGKSPSGASGDVEAVLGKFAKTRFYAGEALMPVKLIETSYSVIPKGYSVVAMKANDVSIANVIQPGDLVNVMAYFTKSDLIPRTMTKTVLMGVRVYALDGDTERHLGDDRPKQIRTIQLLIHKNDAEAWTYANELGNIRLAVGNDEDYGSHAAEDGANIAGVEFLEWLEDHRQKQEAKIRAEEEAKIAAQQRTATKTNQQSPADNATASEEEGFEIIEMRGNRMLKWRIVPGKLPKLIEDTGADGSAGDDTSPADAINGGTTPAPLSPAETDQPIDFLNGEDSPFFQPTGDAESFSR